MLVGCFDGELDIGYDYYGNDYYIFEFELVLDYGCYECKFEDCWYIV